ncbi:MAG: hypothetical protein ROO76_06925 [Terriglobia bacterium]|jgi:mono/diheme cytochrome c family protein|nr:hypothetical protein [Terriglobia bacterium]
MKNRSTSVFTLALAALLGTALAVQPSAGSAPQASARRDSAKGRNQGGIAGAELFAIHCGRCHQPPDDLSPRVIPAVLAHMRTRAMLSHHDEQELLKFLAAQ